MATTKKMQSGGSTLPAIKSKMTGPVKGPGIKGREEKSANKGYQSYKDAAIKRYGSEEKAREVGAVKKMKTGGVVNPNANLQAAKSAGSKGVKSGVNPKAAASKVAKGRVGGTSVAPKAAMPKAIGSTKKYQDGGPTGNSPENQIKRSMIKSAFNNARNTTKARSGKPVGKI